jgi:DNA-binding Lrp family transcriptional regulator
MPTGDKKVTIVLNKFQKELCNIIQEPLPLCPAPFAVIAERLDSDEAAVIGQLQELKSLGIIRRFSASINYRALGKVAVLVTAQIPNNDLTTVTCVINALPGVSHNYLRDHEYNLWFTLQADSIEKIEKLLANLSNRLGCEFHSMPATKVFKLRVRFDADFPEKALALADVEADACNAGTFDSEPVNLTSLEKDILIKLQTDLVISPRPFDFLATDTIVVGAVIETIQSLIGKGVIRPLNAVLNHHKLGFGANVMFCAEVGHDRVDHVGKKLARLKVVSHCYERKTFEGWSYNLFAMMHARTPEQIRQVIDQFTSAEQIDKFELLTTAAELKKQPVKQNFN